MAGIDWNALPLIAEILGVNDMELFVEQLLAIREFDEAKQKAEREQRERSLARGH